MSSLFIKASRIEKSNRKTIKLPIDTKGFVNPSTLQCLFPGASGLKYKLDDSNMWKM